MNKNVLKSLLSFWLIAIISCAISFSVALVVLWMTDNAKLFGLVMFCACIITAMLLGMFDD